MHENLKNYLPIESKICMPYCKNFKSDKFLKISILDFVRELKFEDRGND